MTAYRNEVTEANVGARIMVRHMVVDQPGSPRVPTDVIGHLVAADATTFTVQPRSGVPVDVPRTHVIASKLLPPPPVRRPRPQSGSGPS